MNPTKIEWTEWTWNPITGCKNNCPYCYARRIARRFSYGFEPRFHPSRLHEPATKMKPSKIFVCSMGEMFGEWVNKQWVDEIIRVMENNPRHTFQILTKCPENLEMFLKDRDMKLPNNVWIGVSVDMSQKLNRVEYLRTVDCGVRFISFEPLHSDMGLNDDTVANNFLKDIGWVIVGAETGRRRNRIEPEQEWITRIVNACKERDIPVFLKDNIGPYYRGTLIQQFPDGGYRHGGK